MKVPATLAALTMSALSAEAQERPQGGVAPDAVYKIAPQLGRYTDEVLFGQVWPDTTLAPRDRSLLTVSSLIAMGRTEQLRGHAGRALDNGVTPEELSEVLSHLAFYAGWPVAISSVYIVEDLFAERGITVAIDTNPELLPQEEEAEAARAARVDQTMRPVAPSFADETDQVLFADLWLRPGLAPRDRSLITVAALIAMGQAEQLPFHLSRAMDNGLTLAEAQALPQHVAHYAGWPRAASAMAPMRAVFEAKGHLGPTAPASSDEPTKVLRSGTDTRDAPEENFTGAVRVGSMFSALGDAALGGGVVSFEAGAHTAWHTHPLGQTLFITEGCALVQSEGQEAIVAGPGDIVQIPPRVRHWHGASPQGGMVHLAISESLGGSGVTWLEKVSDTDYAASAERAACPVATQ